MIDLNTFDWSEDIHIRFKCFVCLAVNEMNMIHFVALPAGSVEGDFDYLFGLLLNIFSLIIYSSFQNCFYIEFI